ncbi:MAG TPA: hypothetical protein VLS48_09350 [Anaerolineales bacterium]|nr:hypothetical protein [Anaerolineales bacterium]
MNSSSPTVIPVRNYLPTAFILMFFGWSGLGFIILTTTPNGLTRWALFFCGLLAVTGTALPLIAFLNRRFPSLPPPTPVVVIRQSLWVGVYFSTLAWLQLSRALTPALAALLALGLVIIEWLLRIRERSVWKQR